MLHCTQKNRILLLVQLRFFFYHIIKKKFLSYYQEKIQIMCNASYFPIAKNYYYKNYKITN